MCWDYFEKTRGHEIWITGFVCSHEIGDGVMERGREVQRC